MVLPPLDWIRTPQIILNHLLKYYYIDVVVASVAVVIVVVGVVIAAVVVFGLDDAVFMLVVNMESIYSSNGILTP